MAEIKEKYDHQKLDAKWQKYWEKQKLFLAKETGAKKYVLDMFPYPSGEGLHVGHPEGYIASDIMSHYYRLNNFNVLHPMGFDAFGLPAENAAIKKNIPPTENTAKNIERFSEQLRALGFSYNWDRLIITSDPEYYKWTQWLFLLLYKNGLAYQKEAYVNWCPNDKTVLANEQVIGGCCERCGTAVVQEKKKQWFFKITDFAEDLLQGLEKLDWPDSTKEIQRNWIGKSEGADLEFKVKNSETTIKVFTTRPDTLFGATYMVLAPEYADLDKIVTDEYRKKVQEYQKTTAKKTELDRIAETKDKTGVFTGAYAVNPANNEEIPIWVADYVLAGYGYGAIMAVPAHDERDYQFAKKYDLPIQQVILPIRIDHNNPPQKGKKVIERKTIHAIVRNPKDGKFLCLKWKKQPWTTFIVGGVNEDENIIDAAKREILEETGYKNVKLVRILGGVVRSEYYAAHKGENRIANNNTILFDLIDEARDSVNQEEQDKHEIVWLDCKTINPNNFTCSELDLWFDRINNNHDYYVGKGTVINSGKLDGLIWPQDSDKIIQNIPGATTRVQYRLRDWLVSRQRYWGAPIPILYDKDEQPIPIKEKDLPVILPTDVEFRPTGESPLTHSEEFKKLPGGYPGAVRREYDTLDTFVCSSWYYMRYADPQNTKEFAGKDKLKYWLPVDVYIGGAEHSTGHLIFARFITKVLCKLGYINFDEPFLKLRHQGMILGENGEKMSKSRGNVINPDEVVEGFGADALRMYEMFMGPFDQAKPWNTAGIEGVKKFLDRVYRLVQERVKLPEGNSKEGDLHRLIIKITEDIEEFHFNTAVSAFMIFVNNAIADGKSNSWLDDFVILLAPFAPHLAEELWQGVLGKKESIFLAKWPVADLKRAKLDKITIIIQEQGKKRGSLEIPAGADEDVVINLIKQDAKLAVLAESKQYKFVPDRIINFY